jgi:hypothetical protein
MSNNKLKSASEIADMGEEVTEETIAETTPESQPWESTAGKTRMTREQLMKIHNESQEKGFGWASDQAIKDAYQISGHTLALLTLHYDLPRIRFDSRKQPVYSLPALNWVMSNAPELQDTSDIRPLRESLEQIESDAVETVRADYIARLNSKLSTI